MSTQPSDRNLALFIDFDNVALGARDARMRFDCHTLLQRILEKGKVVVKRAYADWHYYKEHMTSLHEAAIELIEVPMPKISGKNSADIRMVVDAIDLCYSKDHIDTFVLVSGDSDFSPLVSKLRENNKRVIGIGVRNSSSHLLIANCDEWIFYDDIYQSTVIKLSEKVASVPREKRALFDFLLATTQSLLQESRGVLYSSLVKDTMKRKQPDFNETNYGYATFGDLLEDMRDHGLLAVERDSRAGGTLVVLGIGKTELNAITGAPLATRTKARRGRRRERDRNGGPEAARSDASSTEATTESTTEAPVEASAASGDTAATGEGKTPRRSRRRSSRRRRAASSGEPATAESGSEPGPAQDPAPSPAAGAAPAERPAPEPATTTTAGTSTAGTTSGRGSRKTSKKTAKKTPAEPKAETAARKTAKKAAKAVDKAANGTTAKKAAKKAKKTSRKTAAKSDPSV